MPDPMLPAAKIIPLQDRLNADSISTAHPESPLSYSLSMLEIIDTLLEEHFKGDENFK